MTIYITTDAVVISIRKILLIKRKKEPFKNFWALPGGFINYGEKAENACLRELKEETSLTGEIRKLIGVYSDPKRDPRGHTITIAYLIKNTKGKIKAKDDAKEINWFSIKNLPKLAFDHSNIVKDALQSIK